MPGQRPRRSNLIRRRRRVEDEGEEEGSVIQEHLDDSQSEASVPSDVDQDADVDDSDLSGTDAPGPSVQASQRPSHRSNGPASAKKSEKRSSTPPATSQSGVGSSFAVMGDTDVMLNGMQPAERPTQEGGGLDFESLGDQAPAQPVVVRTEGQQNDNRRQETLTERRRREHEEYKKKRDSDPAFVPTRGNFFMHDSRAGGAQQNGFRPFPGRGRGRGRNGVGGPFPPATSGAQAPDLSTSQWAHDLHESLMEPEAKPEHQPVQRTQNVNPSIPLGPSAATTGQDATAGAARHSPPQPRSFSTTTLIATTTVRVFLPGMKEPKLHSMRVTQYAKLPNHRPPLRRDKPVRISLPEHPARYIFPSVDRSFIFIPRALRPNQQGFGSRRGGRFGSGTGFSSRRTSVYGGSVYSPSVVASRRSSIVVRDFDRTGLVSPAGSIAAGHPVVRLPPGRSQQGTAISTPIHSAMVSSTGTPVSAIPPIPGYPLPQQPTYRENLPANMHMHQPRPQKAVSVAGIESPAQPFQVPQQPQEQLPFHQQVPQHLNGNVPRPGSSSFYPPGQQIAFQPQPTVGTPLSHIPERAIHAQPFQPFNQQTFQPGFAGQAPYYYPNVSQPPYGSGAVIAPMFVPNQQGNGYVVPTIAPAVPANVQPTGPSAVQSNMVAYESNGMVYYYDPSQFPAPAEGFGGNNYGVPGVNGMMNAAPEGYYYPQMPPGTMYYPQQ